MINPSPYQRVISDFNLSLYSLIFFFFANNLHSVIMFSARQALLRRDCQGHLFKFKCQDIFSVIFLLSTLNFVITIPHNVPNCSFVL